MPALAWFMFGVGVFSILVSGLYLRSLPPRRAHHSPFFSRRFRQSFAAMLFFQGCWSLLAAALQAWPLFWRNGIVVVAAFTLPLIGVLFAGVSMFTLRQRVHERLNNHHAS